MAPQLVALHEVRERPSFANVQANPVAHVQQNLLSAPGQHSIHASAASSTSSEWLRLAHKGEGGGGGGGMTSVMLAVYA